MREKLHGSIGFAIDRSSLEVQPADTNRIAGDAHRKSRGSGAGREKPKKPAGSTPPAGCF
ncbi:Protein of unknown function [Pyronema omphalodes CBS 100304]|uniref:Uncharacterized protein n=1 Tax=Pyronema omphalodes (strain CBS 100304) TaxID=1076935 RepID=U4L146_PYROM|nr:Protein of unknown function [Pyronema omphalodes CBS 100304]